MRKSKRTLILGLLLFEVLSVWKPERCSAAIIRVPADQNTITKALESAKKGDTIQISKGTYVENIVMKPGIILEGGYSSDYSKRNIDAYETIIDGKNNKGPVVIMAEDSTLDGFTVINGSRKINSDNSISGAGIFNNQVSSIILNNRVKNNEPAGIYFNGSTSVVKNNIIMNNTEAGIFLEKASDLTIIGNNIKNNNFGGISAGDEPANKPNSKLNVRNNTIHGNGKAGIDTASATGTFYNNLIYKNIESGIRAIASPVDITNNTIIANGRSGIIILDPNALPIIKNNIIAHNTEAGIRSSKGGYSHNLLFSNFLTDDCNPEYLWCVRNQFGGYEDEEHYKKTNNIIADPLFVNIDLDDYHLRGNSPAIDAGDPEEKFNDVNFAPSLGTPLNDIGAYGGPYTIAEKRNQNNPPESLIITDKNLIVGERVILDGRGSKDKDGDSITYQWNLLATPVGSTAEIKKKDKAKSSFRADKAGNYEVQLVVTDRLGLAGKPTIQKITVLDNHPPKAHIADILSFFKVGDKVTVYGGGSKDKDNDPLTYQWKIIYKPEQSNIVIKDAHSENTSFQLDANGGYVLQLIVNDGKVDSEPDVVHISTDHFAENGIRNVPAEYPSIQQAVDAASDGDTILVQKGIYEENIILDKNVNLKGIDWPVINGKYSKGNANTIQFAYLGDGAGKIEGFVVTGGGVGGLGHGLNVWDSSPEIYNNIIHGNNHNGIGIHGKGTLTSKTKIHNNLIYDNGLGIGNGLGSSAYIYNNKIFNNKVVGIGCRGLSLPRIEGNYIYENRIGIGTREVSSPYIIGNHIYNNVNGIVIGLTSTIKKFVGPDIIIKNNLIYGNSRVGISATSFNMSKIIVINNTIDNNNTFDLIQRAGGLVFGWPEPAEFTAIVENNIITNNRYAGIANNIGVDLFPAPGAAINNRNNLVWNNSVEYYGVKPGEKEISKDPLYIKGKAFDSGQYFLAADSPALNSGNKSAKDLNMDESSTQPDKTPDKGKADLGYHYPTSNAEFIEKEF